jgi:sensor histidine kinase YesM
MIKKISTYWACQILGWSGVAITLLIFSYSSVDAISRLEFVRCLVISTTGLVTTHLLRILVKKTSILRLPIKKTILFSAILVIIALIAFAGIVLYVNSFLDFSRAAKKYGFFKSFAVWTFIGAFFIIPWFLIYYSFGYIQKIRRQEVDSLKLYGYLKELELKTIKTHLNPHFIFNALNSIRALIEENPERAKQGIVQLSNILRNSTLIEKMETVEFKVELDLVKDYLALEHMRFENRLLVSYDIDDETLQLKVPPMMLQTLVENAVKHGISKLIQGGTIQISSNIKNDFHELSVENSGIFIEKRKNGFGISSTTQRLDLLYGKDASVRITGLENRVVTIVRIPLKKVLVPIT